MVVAAVVLHFDVWGVYVYVFFGFGSASGGSCSFNVLVRLRNALRSWLKQHFLPGAVASRGCGSVVFIAIFGIATHCICFSFSFHHIVG